MEHLVFSWRYPCRSVTKEDVIDFLQGNVAELAEVRLLDEERLRSNAGFLIDWIAAQLLPPSVHPERISFYRFCKERTELC